MTPSRLRGRVQRKDVVAGALITALGVVLLASARRIERLPSDTEVIGPSAFPTALSVLLVLAGLALTLSALRGAKDEGTGAMVMQDEDCEEVAELVGPDEPPAPARRLLVMVTVFAAYCFLLIPVGFLISTAAYLAAVTCLVDSSKWKRNLLFAVGFSVIVYVAFTQLLAVELPPGLLG